MTVCNNHLAKSLKNFNNGLSLISLNEPALEHHYLGRKKMWASRGILEVKFIEQEDTPGASRALWAESNRSKMIIERVGTKPGR